MRLRVRRWIGVVAAGLVCAGCGGREVSGPPELRAGRDQCVECGMLIHDGRCAGAFLIEREGRREHLLFDDVGCMLDHQLRLGAETRIVEGFVRDHSAREWVTSAAAVFLRSTSDEIRTPMGSGIIAFADGAGAEAAGGRFGGELMGYGELLAARRARLDDRRSRAPGGP